MGRQPDPPVDETERNRRSPRRVVLIVAACVVALDAISKALAVRFLTDGGTISVLGGAVHLELYRNFAGPHDTLEGHPVLVSLLALAAVAAIAAAAARVRTRSSAVAFGLLLGGGVGNLLDRLLRAPGPLRGGVIDWLQPPWSNASMNLADLSITTAVLVVIIGAAHGWWRGRGEGRERVAPAPSPSEQG